ncbi:MAG TPA: S8 family serine peptidase [Streptosporangiaceae bacterium]|nr:S8 family serine peptidase [Streptosporangiaceae bacterium]
MFEPINGVLARSVRSRLIPAAAAALALTTAVLSTAPALADQVRNNEWWLASLHVTKAWMSSQGAGVTVAVLDTGVDPTQPDLTGSVITGPDYTGSGRQPGSAYWGVHGTAVASLIAGHGHGPHQSAGITGVAPKASILSVRVVLDSADPLLADPPVVAALPNAIARGIRYAVSHGAKVIDLPLDPSAAVSPATPGGSVAERAAVAYAERKGLVLVAPAGDDGAGRNIVNYPAAYPGVISVGAFNRTFVKAPFSSRQPYVTLTSAGDGVAVPNGLTGYTPMRSTAAASAIVAGMVALIRSQFPTLAPAKVTAALTRSTVYHPAGGARHGSGHGTADAVAALLAAARLNAAVTDTQGSSATPGAGQAPPSPPAVRAQSSSLWLALRYPVAGLAAVLLIALAVLFISRIRQRRARAARLAPVRQAARLAASQPTRRPSAARGATPSRAGRQEIATVARPAGSPPSAPEISTVTRPAVPRVTSLPSRTIGGTPPPAAAGGPAGAAMPTGFPADAVAAKLAGTPRPAGTDGPAAPADTRPPGSPVRAPGASHRLSTVRAPVTSANPPWGPAEKPTGEVPWGAAAPPPRPVSGRPAPPRRAFPDEALATPPLPTPAGSLPAGTGAGSAPDQSASSGQEPSNLFAAPVRNDPFTPPGFGDARPHDPFTTGPGGGDTASPAAGGPLPKRQAGGGELPRRSAPGGPSGSGSGGSDLFSSPARKDPFAPPAPAAWDNPAPADRPSEPTDAFGAPVHTDEDSASKATFDWDPGDPTLTLPISPEED